jgi:hypothetical protein
MDLFKINLYYILTSGCQFICGIDSELQSGLDTDTFYFKTKGNGLCYKFI